jgi:hypothetical protein
MNKDLIYSLIIVFMFVFGVFLGYRWKVSTIEIIFPEPGKTTVTFQHQIPIFEVARHEVPLLQLDSNSLGNEIQIYADSLVYKSDSLSYKAKAKIKVNVIEKISDWDWEIEVKPLFKTVTDSITIQVPKIIYPAFYENEWFWRFLILSLTTLAGFFLWII